MKKKHSQLLTYLVVSLWNLLVNGSKKVPSRPVFSCRPSAIALYHYFTDTFHTWSKEPEKSNLVAENSKKELVIYNVSTF